uniref:Uncharacterized protein n=1 Tax=Solanum tuberosum TaxID=4113 RepID=M1DXZ0_SOLTU
MDTMEQKRNKAIKIMKKRRPEDRPNHWAIHQWPRALPTSNAPSAERVLAALCTYWLNYLEVNMSDEEMNDSQAGHRDDIDDINSVNNPDQSGVRGAICIPQTDGNVMFEVTSTNLHLLQMRGLYGGLDHEGPHEHEHMKGTCGVFIVEEGSFSSYSKPRENQSWNSKRCEEGFYPRYWQRGGN